MTTPARPPSDALAALLGTSPYRPGTTASSSGGPQVSPAMQAAATPPGVMSGSPAPSRLGEGAGPSTSSPTVVTQFYPTPGDRRSDKKSSPFGGQSSPEPGTEKHRAIIKKLFDEEVVLPLFEILPMDEERFDNLPGRASAGADSKNRGAVENRSPSCPSEWQAFLHGATRLLSGEEALLVDTGAVDNVTGGDFIARQRADGAKHGHGTKVQQMERPKRLSGVGDAAKPCTTEACVPGVLRNGEKITYNAPVLPGDPSPIPPLYGLRAMAEENVFIGARPGTLSMVPSGKEGQIVWPKGTQHHKLQKAPSGHWMLPVGSWSKYDGQGVAHVFVANGVGLRTAPDPIKTTASPR